MLRSRALISILAFACGQLAAGVLPCSGADERDLEVDSVRVPFYLPAWGGEHPLESIRARARAGDRLAAEAGLQRLCTERAGTLLPPLADPRRTKISRIAPAEEILAGWATKDVAVAALGPPPSPPRAGPGETVLPLDGTASLLWSPGQREAARLRFELAVARGDDREAQRVLASPNAPACAAELRGWLEGRWCGTQAPLSTSGWRPSFPGTELAALPTPEGLALVYQTRVEWSVAQSDPEQLLPDQVRGIPRRFPTGAIYPLVDEDELLVSDGAALLRIGLGKDPRLVEEALPIAGAAHRALRHMPIIGSVGGRYLAFPARTERPESEAWDMHETVAPAQETIGYQTIALFAAERGGAPVPVECSELHEALRGASLAGPALFDAGRRVYLPLIGGWSTLEIEVICYDLEERRISWRRRLATKAMAAHSRFDLQTQLAEMRITRYGGMLLVETGHGFLARIDAATGEARGLLFYERYRDDAGSAPAQLFEKKYFTRPTPRQRALGPVLYVARTDAQAPLVLFLPPDALALLAVDPMSWTIVWQHPVAMSADQHAGRLSMLLGRSPAGGVLLLDAGAARRAARLTLYELDPHTGRLLADPRSLRLRADLEESRRSGTTEEEGADRHSLEVGGRRADLEPVLAGLPLLTREALWIPSLLGLEVWRLEERTDGQSELADRFLPWPPGAIGGTPIPLPDGRFAITQRGDLELGISGAIEIYETRAPAGGR